ncbi:odorant receptor Or1-like [Tribolium madens]|uniref:odorant receptor Or1-like n=1 Tax=Tribolium madens TaxID=41895 RepID=UPI001CF73E82|nr:odorant receptor Or1-like [Tribolium madens]
MSSLAEQSFKINFRILKVTALYPPTKNKQLNQVLAYVMYLLFVVPVPILQVLNLLLQEKITFMQIIDNAFMIAELGCLIPKFWPFVHNNDCLVKCIHYFDSPVFEVRKNRHKELLQNCIKVCRAITIFFVVAVSSGFTSWSSRPISWENHIFPTDLWLPYDPKVAPKLYNFLVYAYIVVAVGYSAYNNATIDPLISGLSYQATTQIKILKDNLQHLGEDTEDEYNNQSVINRLPKSEIMYAKIVKCVKHHNLILDFVKEYQYCFAQCAFSQIAGSVVVLCVSCLQLTIVDILSFDCLAMILFLISMLSEVYFFCHFGTLLYEESNTISDAIYMGSWYDYDKKSKQALTILMERAKRPVIVISGKLVELSLITFSMILRRSYSLLAVLENYNIELN